MFSIIRNLFKSRPSVDFSDLIARGALVIDVRSKAEYKGGHFAQSVNYPLNELPSNIGRLDRSRPIITVCASGMRSATAMKLLLDNGFKEVYNAGGWNTLERMIRRS
jgi:rhodanese-related sulfurtransferase